MADLYSYHAANRSNDDCSRYQRARNLDDIRTRHRQLLALARIHIKRNKMIKNRHSLSNIDDQGLHDNPIESDFNDSSSDDDDLQSQRSNFIYLDTPATSVLESQWSSSSEEDLPSCTWSAPSTYRKSLSSPTRSNSGSESDYSVIATRSTRVVSSMQLKKSSYKQLSFKNSPTARSSTSAVIDLNQTIANFNLLSAKIVQASQDAETISNIVIDNWSIVTTSLASTSNQLRFRVVEILSRLAKQGLLTTRAISHMLQHQLIFRIKEFLMNLGDDQLSVEALELLINICRKVPSSIPLIIDLSVSCKLRECLEEIILFASHQEVQVIVEYLSFISQYLMSQLFSQTPDQPLIPEVLIQSGLSVEKTYGPMPSLINMYTQSLILNIVNRCLVRENSARVELVGFSLLVLANALRLAHVLTNYPDHHNTLSDIISVFTASPIERSIQDLITGSRRLIAVSNSSDHSSQGVGVDHSASLNLEQCLQFVTFYQQYYGSLASPWAHLIKDVQVQQPTRAGWTL